MANSRSVFYCFSFHRWHIEKNFSPTHIIYKRENEYETMCKRAWCCCVQNDFKDSIQQKYEVKSQYNLFVQKFLTLCSVYNGYVWTMKYLKKMWKLNEVEERDERKRSIKNLCIWSFAELRIVKKNIREKRIK